MALDMHFSQSGERVKRNRRVSHVVIGRPLLAQNNISQTYEHALANLLEQEGFIKLTLLTDYRKLLFFFDDGRIVKFVQGKNGVEAHKYLAKEGFAPKLHQVII